MKVCRYSIYSLLVALLLFSVACSHREYISLVRNTPISTVPKALVKDSLPVLMKRSAEVLKCAYMADKLLGVYKNLPGWVGYPVKLYEYHTPKDIRAGVKKKGLVYLLNPSPRQLAMWVMTTVWYVKQNMDYKYTQKLLERIKSQSGAQFPVAGVVYEGEVMEKNLYVPYIFKDGVTVYVADSTKKSTELCPTDEMLHYYLTLTDSQIKSYTGRYARICGTTREQYREFGGLLEVGYSDGTENRKVLWLQIVRNLYKKAYKSDYNELMIVWARQEL